MYQGRSLKTRRTHQALFDDQTILITYLTEEFQIDCEILIMKKIRVVVFILNLRTVTYYVFDVNYLFGIKLL